MAAILEGSIQYFEIPQGRSFFFDDCWNDTNDLYETGEAIVNNE